MRDILNAITNLSNSGHYAKLRLLEEYIHSINALRTADTEFQFLRARMVQACEDANQAVINIVRSQFACDKHIYNCYMTAKGSGREINSMLVTDYVGCIKAVREQYACSLSDAKAKVDKATATLLAEWEKDNNVNKEG